MGQTDVKTPLREVRLRVAACFALIMLSSDALNPVKLVCGILGIECTWATLLFCFAFVVIISANAKELIYFMVKVFFHSILSIFFSSMEVLGKQNIPQHGPIIFSGNHMNQFVDGAVLLVTNPHRLSFLVAEKSYNTRIIGGFAKAVSAIPVARPQDKAVAGQGRICFVGLKLMGEGTSFTTLKKGDKLRPGRSPDSYKVKEVISDTEGILVDEYGEASPLNEKFCQGEGNWTNYDILEFVDQSKMFDGVQAALAQGKCLGIFPEGGSHDNTDLLPLKVGVAAIALGALEKFDVSVPIVPVGLNYFHGHRFRGRVVVEFGEPISITEYHAQLMQESKRTAYQTLLKEVEDGMRSVIVTAPDYGELKLIHTVRRMFQRSTNISTKTKQDLARRFSAAQRLLKEKYNGNLPQDLLDLQKKLEDYQDILDKWGLRDYQLLSGQLELSYSKLVYIFLHGAVIILLASIPSLILNAPVGFAAHYWAEKEAKKDLKASRVKIEARDVLLSRKILFSIVAVPVLWISYTILLLLFSSWERRTIFVLFLSLPLFSYLGVMAVEAGMIDFKDLRPAFLRLLPSFRNQCSSLPKLRAQLQKEVRAMVAKYGPELGPIYHDQTDAWENSAKKAPKIAGMDSPAAADKKVL
eukprot:gene8093-10962_t